MGSTATAWSAAVLGKLNDAAGIDVSAATALSVGVVPALAQFSIDRPNTLVVDLTPSGRYLPLPSAGQGWVSGWSDIARVEAPAGYTPPCRLDPGQWVVTRDPSDPTVTRVLLPAELADGEEARVWFSSTWPTPTATASDDLVPAPAFEPVAALAASYVCTALASSASLGRQGALPTDFVDGTERARNLLEAAAGLRVLYNTFIGLGSGQTSADSSQAKVLRSTRFR